MPTRSRSFIVFLALCTLATPAIAHKIPSGVYTRVPYNNNPFLFCKYGMPQDGWVSVNWRTGTWTPIRKYPNLRWVPTYVYICPAADRPAGGPGPYTPADSTANS